MDSNEIKNLIFVGNERSDLIIYDIRNKNIVGKKYLRGENLKGLISSNNEIFCGYQKNKSNIGALSKIDMRNYFIEIELELSNKWIPRIVIGKN